MTSDSVVCLPSKASGDDTSASHVIEAREGTHTLSWAGGQGRDGDPMLPPHLTMPHDGNLFSLDISHTAS